MAEVLPDNRRMIQVFREQGYVVKGGWDDGVMHLEFDIDPTETSMGVIAAREHRSEAASIAAFLNARSVAVIGASRRSDTIGAVLVRNLVLGDYAGRVYVVNPAADAVAGMPAYGSVGEIPGDVDVPSSRCRPTRCRTSSWTARPRASTAWSSSPAGSRRPARRGGCASASWSACRSYGLRLIGPNCLGVINTASDVSLNASLAP